MSVAEKGLSYGIRLQDWSPGSRKTTCPQCSHSRKKKNDPCLSVTIDGDDAVWKCWHCQWSGSTKSPAELERKPVFMVPVLTGLPQHVEAWFSKRGIGPAVLRDNHIGWHEAYSAIAFPSYLDGKVVNVKYRTLDKRFSQSKGGQRVFFGCDRVTFGGELVIVEGEMDKLACDEAGIANVISVPDGAPSKVSDGRIDPSEDGKFAFVWNCRAVLEAATKVILATDGDGPGKALAEELARRIGKEKCWLVTWPDSNDTTRKDANDVLLTDGPDVLREVIRDAKPYPIQSLHSFDDYRDDILNLYRAGRQRAASTGWRTLDPYMTIREGELSIVTGIPNSGKSEFIDALMVNLARAKQWKFALCSFENPPEEHAAKLAEKARGLPFWDGPSVRMSEQDLLGALSWVNSHFCLIRAGEESPTIDFILTAAKAAVARYGIRGLCIDPYNEIEHQRAGGKTETEYVSETLSKVKRFAQNTGCHVWFIAHPAKMQRDSSGKYPVPSLYDISGSAHWVNKADLGVVVHRDPNINPPQTDIYVRKVRFKAVGKIGSVTLAYDKPTGRYSDMREDSDGEYR